MDSTVSLLVLLHKTKVLEPKLNINQRIVIGRMVNKVCDFHSCICTRIYKPV